MLNLSAAIPTSPLDRVPVALDDTNFASLRNLSEECEQALITRARSGDQAARDELLLWVLSPVKRFAARYYLAFYWEASASVSPDDLVSEATLRMLERWPAALTASNPLAYLLSVAYATIRHTMAQERSPIRTPYTPGERPIPVKSLHAPLGAESDDTLLDVLPAAHDIPKASCDEEEYRLLYQAAARLSERERAVIAEWYGLYETAPASMETILSQIGRTGMGSYKASALMKLYRLLAPVYSQYCGSGYVQELRAPGGHVHLSDSKQERLDTAYAQLQESGQPLTASCLAHTAQISNTQASLYLHQRGAGVLYYQRVLPTEDRALRVAAAYAQLQASGQEITRRTLGTAAHVNWHYAAAYIQQQQGGPSCPPRFGGKRDPQEREARLAAAYEQLQQGAHHMSAEALSKAAHVRRQTADSYLRQRRVSSPEEALA